MKNLIAVGQRKLHLAIMAAIHEGNCAHCLANKKLLGKMR